MNKKPKILIWDLEVLANMREVRRHLFSMGDYPGRTIKASVNSVICFGYKWLGEKKTHVISAWDFKSWKKDVNDDRALLRAAKPILLEADGWVTHYGKKFDEKFMNTRLLLNKLGMLPRKFPHVDTKQAASRLFFYSNSLGELARELDVPHQKMSTSGKDLWLRVADREKKAQVDMSKYCAGDVRALEGVFLKLRPMVTGLPNYNLFIGEGKSCPTCGGYHIQSRGKHLNSGTTYDRHQCMSCGSWSYLKPSSKRLVGL